MTHNREATDKIAQTEVSEKFVELMRDAMLMSFYKYGRVADAYPHKVDAIGSLMQRLRLYANGDPDKGIVPGNTEYLVDAANFAMIEFMLPRHPHAHFVGKDEDGSPGRVSLHTGKADKRDNAEIGRGEHKSITAAFR